jgi:hypothetical protein
MQQQMDGWMDGWIEIGEKHIEENCWYLDKTITTKIRPYNQLMWGNPESTLDKGVSAICRANFCYGVIVF